MRGDALGQQIGRGYIACFFRRARQTRCPAGAFQSHSSMSHTNSLASVVIGLPGLIMSGNWTSRTQNSLSGASRSAAGPTLDDTVCFLFFFRALTPRRKMSFGNSAASDIKKRSRRACGTQDAQPMLVTLALGATCKSHLHPMCTFMGGVSHTAAIVDVRHCVE
jgi:hypothetical protein